MHSRLRRPAAALLTTALAASVLGIVPAAYAADGTATGTVSGPNGPIVGASVQFYLYDEIEDRFFYEDYALTVAGGTYTKALAPGTYRISFGDASGNHVAEYYDDATEFEDADPVVVPDGGGAPAANAVLAPSSHVTGTVTGPGGAALAEVSVSALRAYDDGGGISYEQVSGGWTDERGRYDIGGLPAGTYRIRFGDDYIEPDHPTDYATEWYVDRRSLYSAANVAVGVVQTVGNINAQLTLDGEIAGTVTDAADAAYENVDVDAYVLDEGDWVSVMQTSTDELGHYVLDGLAAGIYRVRFRDYSDDDLIREFWNNKGLLGNAANVVVGEATVAGVNAKMVAGEHDAEVAPTVANTALPTISGSPLVGSTLTATTGSWSAAGGYPAVDEFYYDWLRDGQFIDGEHAATYVPTAADTGKKISVLVSAGAPLHDYGNAESAPTAPVTATAPVVAPPVVTPPVVTPPAPVVDVPTALSKALASVKVTGKPQVGKTLKVANLDLDVRTAVTYTFQWFAGTRKIRKATRSKLKVVTSMEGKRLSVKVTGTAGATSTSVKIKVGKVR